MKKITVLLAEDHTIVREGLRGLLQAAEDIQVIGEATNGYQSVREAKRLQPDVVLLDLAMPLLNGLEATRQIAKEVRSTKVLILSAYSDDQHVQEAIDAGATGYLMKGTAATDLLRGIRQISKGKAFFNPPVPSRSMGPWRKTPLDARPAGTKGVTLTSRQTEILQLLAEGYANKQIAEILSISIKTVEKHRQTLMHRLKIHEVATLTRYAVSSGLIESNRLPAGLITSAPPCSGVERHKTKP